MVTSQGGLDEILEGMSAGADDYLVKPLDSDDLQARLIAAARVTSLHRQLAEQRTELEALNHELTAIARRDPLTGLGNRRALAGGPRAARSAGHPLRAPLLHGAARRRPLQVVQRHATATRPATRSCRPSRAQLKEQARGGDALYRYGGEEFLCIFPEQSLGHRHDRGRAHADSLKRLAIPHADNPLGVLTISAGLAMLDPDHTRSASEVLKEADDALYRAKQLGRNRVEQPDTQPA